MSRKGASARVISVQDCLGQISKVAAMMEAKTTAISRYLFVLAGLNSVLGSTVSTSSTAESTTAEMSSSDPLIDSGSSLERSSTAVEIRSCSSGCRISRIRAMCVRVKRRERGRARNHQAAIAVIASPVRLRIHRDVVEKRVKAASIAMIASRQPKATASVAKSPRRKRSRRIRRIIKSSLFRIGSGSWPKAASRVFMIFLWARLRESDQSAAAAQNPFRGEETEKAE